MRGVKRLTVIIEKRASFITINAWETSTIPGVDFLQTIGAKIVTAALGLAVIAGGISWWRMEQTERDAVLAATARGGAWLLIVLLVPWLLFWVIRRAAKADTNLAGALLVVGLTIAEAVWLGVMFGTRDASTATWTFFGAATVVAGVYNLFTCDWIAEKVN